MALAVGALLLSRVDAGWSDFFRDSVLKVSMHPAPADQCCALCIPGPFGQATGRTSHSSSGVCTPISCAHSVWPTEPSGRPKYVALTAAALCVMAGLDRVCGLLAGSEGDICKPGGCRQGRCQEGVKGSAEEGVVLLGGFAGRQLDA